MTQISLKQTLRRSHRCFVKCLVQATGCQSRITLIKVE